MCMATSRVFFAFHEVLVVGVPVGRGSWVFVVMMFCLDYNSAYLRYIDVARCSRNVKWGDTVVAKQVTIL